MNKIVNFRPLIALSFSSLTKNRKSNEYVHVEWNLTIFNLFASFFHTSIGQNHRSSMTELNVN